MIKRRVAVLILAIASSTLLVGCNNLSGGHLDRIANVDPSIAYLDGKFCICRENCPKRTEKVLDDADYAVMPAPPVSVQQSGPPITRPASIAAPANEHADIFIVQFEFGKSTPTNDGYKTLALLTKAAKQTVVAIELIGETDDIGTQNYNDKLAFSRVHYRYLVSCNTTTTASSVSEADQAKTVVVNDLIFPPGITPDQHDAIRSMLSSSGVAHIHWQAILDELHGAQIHGQKIAAPISNPAGYVRGITKRAADGSFNLERGVAVASQREMRKNLERQDALRVAPQPKFQTAEAQLGHLPENLRGSLSRILANKTREDAGA